MINQRELKELLHYSPETGYFTWILSIGKVKKGDIAGTLTNDGYIMIGVNKGLYLAHRLACLYMTGVWPKEQMDHGDHIRSNNKWDNLTEATNSQNQRNAGKRKDNTSGITGVRWDKRFSKWRALIKTNGRTKNLGLFIDKFEAICARKSANNEYDFHPNHGTPKVSTY